MPASGDRLVGAERHNPPGLCVVDLRAAGTRYRLRVPVSDWIGHVISSTKRPYERRLLTTTLRLVQSGDQVVDVGANIGNHSLFWSQVAGARVIAIEPCDVTYRLLEQNIALNGASALVAPHKVAAGSHQGRVGLDEPAPHMLGSTRVVASATGDVQLVRVDDIVGTELPTRLVKVDVEGYELEVLRGARRILAQRPVVVLEAHTRRDRQALGGYLREFGYFRVPVSMAASPTFIYVASAGDVARLATSGAFWRQSLKRFLGRARDLAKHAVARVRTER